VDKISGGTVTRAVTYYPAGGAVRINITSGSNTLYYILKDHLGSASVVTNSSGTVVGEQRYYPFGETRLTTGSIFTDQLFTGQREMTGLGIYHFNARFYSPKLGRFLSADTIVPNVANPQDLNRFAYVRNNPLRYTDPSGNRPCGDGEKYDCDGRLNPTSPSKPPVVIVPKPGGSGGDKDKNKKDNPPGHEYSAFTLVCPAVFNCTEAEMQEYMTQFQYPGQWPWSPVSDGLDAIVTPARFWNIPNPFFYYGGNQGLGGITVDISDDRSTITNLSKSSHIFHNGLVDRTLIQSEEGWYISTHGTGTNIRTSNPAFNHAIDAMNTAIGDEAFAYGVDLPMFIYIGADQSIQDAGSYILEWLH